MNPDLSDHARIAVESICGLGCDRVNEIIDALESGQNVRETAGLDRSDRDQVLQELKDIMSVYDRESM